MASDYSPPRLVKPTPGGAAGDGSLDGALTVETAGNGGAMPLHLGPRDDSASSGLWMGSSDTSFVIANHAGGDIYLGYGTPQAVAFGTLGGFRVIAGGMASIYNGVAVKGLGLSPIYGLGQRGVERQLGGEIRVYSRTESILRALLLPDGPASYPPRRRSR